MCFDVDPEALDRAREHVTTGRYGLERGVERQKLSREQADAALDRLSFTNRFEDAADADLVIEAVPERLSLKVSVFRQLDAAAPPGAVLASNTSGFPIGALAAATDRPESVLGWHWASPAPVMRFAEVVRTAATASSAIDTVCRVATACGKSPVVVNDHDTAWGFVANRVYFAMVGEARRVVEEGVATREEVDQLMRDCFGWPAGPFGMVRGAASGWG